MHQVRDPSPTETVEKLSAGPLLGASPTVHNGAIGALPTSQGFSALLAAFRATGGTARGEDVARLLDDHRVSDLISVAKLIAGGQVFGFAWRHTLWIPMFQFDLVDLSVRPSTHQALKILGAGYDGWALAAWFARPSNWLNQRAPVDLIASRLTDVLDAARVDRLIATEWSR